MTDSRKLTRLDVLAAISLANLFLLEVWRKLINELARSGALRPELDLYIAQMLVLGALNWTVEWWDSRRGSVDAVVSNAQTLVRHGLTTARATKRR